MVTPIQTVKDNYYKMSESQFHYWMSQNIDQLIKDEKTLVIESYEKGHTDREDNVFKIRTYMQSLYNDRCLDVNEDTNNEHGDYR